MVVATHLKRVATTYLKRALRFIALQGFVDGVGSEV